MSGNHPPNAVMFFVMPRIEWFFQHIFLLVLFLSLSLGIGADEAFPRGWTLGPSLGIHWGRAEEIVYDNRSTPNSNDYYSFLSWDIRPAIMAGMDIAWNSGRYVAFDATLSGAIPGLPSGEMWDYDWLTRNDPDPTLWSRSNVHLRWGFIIDTGIDFTLLSSQSVRLQVGGGYHLDWWAWGDETVDSSYGLEGGLSGIDYETAYHVPHLRVGVDAHGGTVFGSLVGKIGPVFAASHDHHKLRTEPNDYPVNSLPPNVDGLHFYDRAFGGPWLEAVISLGYQTSGRFSFVLEGEAAWFPEIMGYTIIEYSDGVTGNQISYEAGGFSFERFGLTARFLWGLGKSYR